MTRIVPASNVFSPVWYDRLESQTSSSLSIIENLCNFSSLSIRTYKTSHLSRSKPLKPLTYTVAVSSFPSLEIEQVELGFCCAGTVGAAFEIWKLWLQLRPQLWPLIRHMNR
ncbi:hypothetical protein Pyn_13030 [Prunus yedoensis var. nudiflora]|uniref:Uncharacterized protein n=1 Tax=Prunus yedoensis var. nudiflora TaxID=2094558 RepID=A0A314UL33_PRUYE|nr:hypothetical protein Pyn_13030 [Prunus yedoensis var. nudiflora]